MQPRAEDPGGRFARLHARAPSRVAFAGVFASVLLCFLAIGAVLPVLPRYVHGHLGAADVAVGIVVGAFAFTAVVGRPLAGHLADARGRRVVLAGGALLAAVGGALYFLPLGVPGLVLARLVLGIGDGFLFVAGAAWTVDLAPEERRGQAIGVFGLAIWGGLSIGPALGEGLLAIGSYDAVWAFAAAAPLAGGLLALRLPEAREAPGAPAARGPLIVRDAIGPGVALALANIGYAAVASFVVLHLDARGIDGGAAVFTCFAASVVVARLAAGRLPDRFGGERTAIAAGLAEAAGLAVIAGAHSLAVALLGAAVMGAGFSLLFPSLALVVMNRIDEPRRGAALGSFTSFFDLGFGLGAPLAGAIAAASGYPTAFLVASGLAAGGVLVTGLALSRRPAELLAPADG